MCCQAELLFKAVSASLICNNVKISIISQRHQGAVMLAQSTSLQRANNVKYVLWKCSGKKKKKSIKPYKFIQRGICFSLIKVYLSDTTDCTAMAQMTCELMSTAVTNVRNNAF